MWHEGDVKYNDQDDLLQNTMDWLLVGVFIYILFRTYWTRNYDGLSMKTQYLFGINFLTRYFNLLQHDFTFKSVIVALLMCLTLFIIVLSFRFVNGQRIYTDELYKKDSFSYAVIVALILMSIGSAIPRFHFNHKRDVLLILRPTSYVMEAVALTPQLTYYIKDRACKLDVIICIIAFAVYYITQFFIDLRFIAFGLMNSKYFKYVLSHNPKDLDKIPYVDSLFPIINVFCLLGAYLTLRKPTHDSTPAIPLRDMQRPRDLPPALPPKPPRNVSPGIRPFSVRAAREQDRANAFRNR